MVKEIFRSFIMVAIINIFTTMEKMCNVKGVVHSDEPSETPLQFSAL